MIYCSPPHYRNKVLTLQIHGAVRPRYTIYIPKISSALTTDLMLPNEYLINPTSSGKPIFMYYY